MLKSLFEPCIPTRGTKVPDRPEWIHEIKHDGYRLIIQRDSKRLRLNAFEYAGVNSAASLFAMLLITPDADR